MIRYFFLFFLVCFSEIIKAQSGSDDSEFSDAAYMMNMTPPSPTAFSFSKYGDTQVNESMGIISPQIPIGTYKAGTVALPISMDYSGNGVKVDQASSWTGINWSIAAGGAISRQVRGEDDLMRSGGSKFYSWNDLQSMNIYGSSEDYYEIQSFIYNSSIDSEVDIFYFNFLGYSGSFYLTKENGEFTAHVENSKVPLNIEVLDAEYNENGILEHLKRTMVIQTPDGTKYFFGGLHASETSKSLYPDYFVEKEYVQTGFYLNKIQNPHGDVVYFKYEDYTHNLKTAITESYRKVISSTNNCGDVSVTDSADKDILKTVTQGKYLQRIHNSRNTFEVVFFSEAANLDVSEHYNRILNGIEIRDSVNVQNKLTDVDFLYYFPKGGSLNNKNQAERFFLKEVKFNGGSEQHSYKMEYKNLEQLPNRFSYAQDHLGYYNGKNNYRMLPDTDNYWFRNIGGSALADKSPDFDYASIGVLSKLYYPTKGYSEFEYEAPPGDQQIEEFKTHTTLMYHNDYTRNPTNKNPGVSPLTPTVIEGSNIDCGEEPYVPSQEMTIEINNVFATQMLLHNTKFLLKIYDQSTLGVVYEEDFGYNSANEATQEYNPYYTQTNGVVYRYPNKEFTFSFEEGKQYSVSLEVIPHKADQSAVINASIRRVYYVTYPPPCMVDGSGIRVKRIRDIPVYGEPDEKRYYYYNGSAIKQPQYLYESKIRAYCGGGSAEIPSFIYDDYSTLTLTSSSLHSLYLSNKGQQSYGRVILSLGGDAFENGAIEKEFFVKGDARPQDYFMHSEIYNLPQVLENNSIGNGVLRKETIYKNENEALIPIKEIKKDYSFNKIHSITNNLRSKLYDELSENITDGDNLFLGLYITASYRTDLNKVETRLFNYENLSMSGQDTNNDGLLSLSELNVQPQTLLQQEDYRFEQYVGMPSKKVVQTSETNIKEEYIYQYPEWSSYFITGISEPVKTELHKDNNGSKELKMTKTNEYSNNLGTHPYKTLSTVNIRKGSVSGDSGKVVVQYHDYDDFGNPLEFSRPDGPHTVYLWGYEEQYPVAKIENSDYATVISKLTSVELTHIKAGNYGRDTMISKLDKIRIGLPNAMVTTYTYDPLIGMTSMTDPSGKTTFYSYDEFNRLKEVRDQDQKIISGYEYHYKE